MADRSSEINMSLFLPPNRGEGWPIFRIHLHPAMGMPKCAKIEEFLAAIRIQKEDACN